MKWPKEILSILIASGQKFGADRVTRLAAALAYYTMFSLAPMLIVVTGLISRLLKQLVTADVIALFLERIGLTEEILTSDELFPFIENIIGSEGMDWISDIINSSTEPSIITLAALIGIIIMFWGASNIFNHLKETLNIIWGVKAAPGAGIWVFVRGRILAFAAVFGMGIILILFLLINTIVAALVSVATEIIPDSFEILNTWRVLQISQFIIGFFIMTTIFTLIYKVMPDVQIAWRDVIAGGLATAFLFIIGTIGMAIYFQFSSIGSLYGAAGSIMVILFWFYYSAQIFLFGAEFTQVYSTRFGSRIQPAEHAVAVTSVQVEDLQEGIDTVDEIEDSPPPKTIFRAPAWFLNLAQKIQGMLSLGAASEEPQED